MEELNRGGDVAVEVDYRFKNLVEPRDGLMVLHIEEGHCNSVLPPCVVLLYILVLISVCLVCCYYLVIEEIALSFTYVTGVVFVGFVLEPVCSTLAFL